MNSWMRKMSVILMTMVTLGLYIPPADLTTEAEENGAAVAEKTDESNLNSISDVSEDLTGTTSEGLADLDYEYLTSAITSKAKEQMYTKLGPKIVKQVEDEFMTTILPTMEEALKGILIEAGEEKLTYYSITERPGYGERVFNVYDYRTKKDLARFHVRRDNRPLEGYWFNFHYHLSADNFEEHHELGDIYWDKNIPPKWMS